MRKNMCVRDGEQGEGGMLPSLGLVLGFFPLPAEKSLSVMWTKFSDRTRYEDVILKQIQSLSLTLILKLQTPSE